MNLPVFQVSVQVYVQVLKNVLLAQWNEAPILPIEKLEVFWGGDKHDDVNQNRNEAVSRGLQMNKAIP